MNTRESVASKLKVVCFESEVKKQFKYHMVCGELYDTYQVLFRGTTLLKLSLLPAMPYYQYNPRFEISAIILGLCLRKYNFYQNI